MCTFSLELKKVAKLMVGQKLMVTSLPTQRGGKTTAFALIKDGKVCEEGVCFKTGWGLSLRMSPKQAESLSLFVEDLAAKHVEYFARFVEARHRTDVAHATEGQDVFEVRMGDAVATVPFGQKFMGIKAKVEVTPGQEFVKPAMTAKTQAPALPVPPIIVTMKTAQHAPIPLHRSRAVRTVVTVCVMLMTLAQ